MKIKLFAFEAILAFKILKMSILKSRKNFNNKCVVF